MVYCIMQNDSKRSKKICLRLRLNIYLCMKLLRKYIKIKIVVLYMTYC